MNPRKLIADLLTAFGAQGISFLCSCITALLVPKLLGIEEFGYWQLFVFYASYVSFFQLGLNDGVYLQHGGEDRGGIDKSLLGSEFRVGLCYQLGASLMIGAYGLFFEQDEGRAFVITAAAVYLVISNATFFLSYIFQAINETKISSYSTIVNRGFFLIALVICLLVRVQDFHIYVIFFILAQALSLQYCIWKGKDFVFAKPTTARTAIKETCRSMRIGIVLTIANVMGMLIIGAARLVIDLVWGLNAFGEISLSLSIVNFALAFISQAAMVLFPALRSAGGDQERRYYCQLRDGLSVVMPMALIVYAPLRWLIGLWLPQYYESLFYLAFLFPVCLFEVQSNLTVATFLKVRCEPKALLGVNVAALMLTGVAIAFAVLLVNSPIAVVLAALLGVSMRYVIGTIYLGKVYDNWNVKIMICLFAESAVFMACAYYLPLLQCFIACVAIIAVHCVVARPEAARFASEVGKLRN